jgi:uncharacterized protein (TIGR01777 family)
MITSEERKTIAITGASGFVGTTLQAMFTEQNHTVIPIGRSQLSDSDALDKIIAQSDVVINLAGASIIGRWSESYKKLLFDSRINTTRAIVESINRQSTPPLLISTSAVGIYDQEATHEENSTALGHDYLTTITTAWENEALQSKGRVAITRFGVVLGRGGGALAKMLLPFKLGIGGVIGDGTQPMPYIHLDDLTRAISHIITHNLDGIFNFVAPQIITNRDFTITLGETLSRPTLLPIPGFVFTLLYGEGSIVLTEGQKVIPRRLLDSGFVFEHPDIGSTLEASV